MAKAKKPSTIFTKLSKPIFSGGINLTKSPAKFPSPVAAPGALIAPEISQTIQAAAQEAAHAAEKSITNEAVTNEAHTISDLNLP
jgi:hypothetical protein